MKPNSVTVRSEEYGVAVVSREFASSIADHADLDPAIKLSKCVSEICEH